MGGDAGWARIRDGFCVDSAGGGGGRGLQGAPGEMLAVSLPPGGTDVVVEVFILKTRRDFFGIARGFVCRLLPCCAVLHMRAV